MSDNIEDIEVERMKEELTGQVYGPDEESGNGNAGGQQSGLEANERNGNGNGDTSGYKENTPKVKKEKKKERREFLAYKYSNKKKWALHEAIILTGSPAFLYCENSLGNNQINYVAGLEEDTRIIKPPREEHYPYEPYEFEDMNEVLSYVERARNETIDSLYLQAKQIATDYNDQKKDKVNLLAIEITSSYFQDRFPTTHYDIILGGNGSGKSTYGDTFTAVGYRVVNLTDPNAANINRILGTIEIGQCTIVSDETGAIDKHPDLLSILKTGYSARGKTSKINDNSREPEFFSTYCFKMIISERMPNLRDARGVLDRSFSLTTYKGRPKHDIKETLEPQGNPARQERLDKLNDFRKLMLIYRLLHFKDQIPDVNVGVEGREKELSKPIIQLFYNTSVQNEVETTLQYWLSQRNEKKDTTLEPVLHPMVTRLVKEKGKEIYVRDIWEDIITNSLKGAYDSNKPNEFQSEDYGNIFRNQISNVLEHTFGGRPKHREHGNAFIFDTEELSRVGRAYNLTTTIQTKIVKDGEGNPEGPEGNEGATKECSGCNQDEDVDKCDISRERSTNNLLEDQNKAGELSAKPSDPSGVNSM